MAEAISWQMTSWSVQDGGCVHVTPALSKPQHIRAKPGQPTLSKPSQHPSSSVGVPAFATTVLASGVPSDILQCFSTRLTLCSSSCLSPEFFASEMFCFLKCVFSEMSVCCWHPRPSYFSYLAFVYFTNNRLFFSFYKKERKIPIVSEWKTGCLKRPILMQWWNVSLMWPWSPQLHPGVAGFFSLGSHYVYEPDGEIVTAMRR